MNALPPPTPALWAPGLRRTVMRFFAWMDARKVRRLSRTWIVQADERWRVAYTAWWYDHGWEQGADNPDVAYAKIRAARR